MVANSHIFLEFFTHEKLGEDFSPILTTVAYFFQPGVVSGERKPPTSYIYSWNMTPRLLKTPRSTFSRLQGHPPTFLVPLRGYRTGSSQVLPGAWWVWGLSAEWWSEQGELFNVKWDKTSPRFIPRKKKVEFGGFPFQKNMVSFWGVFPFFFVKKKNHTPHTDSFGVFSFEETRVLMQHPSAGILESPFLFCPKNTCETKNGLHILPDMGFGPQTICQFWNQQKNWSRT